MLRMKTLNETQQNTFILEVQKLQEEITNFKNEKNN